MSLKYYSHFLILFSISYIAGTETSGSGTFGPELDENVILPNLPDPFTDLCLCPEPEYFRCPQRNGRFPHPTNCSLYYLCVNDCACEGQCAEPLRFNAVNNTCDNVTAEFCVQPPQPLKGDIFEGMDPLFHCPRDGVFPHPEFCEKYYSCMNAVSYLYTCKDKLFDSRYNSCNYPELTPCDARKRPEYFPGTVTPPPTTTTKKPTTSIPVYQCAGTHFIKNTYYYYRDPNDCAKFFVCHNSEIVFHGICPKGTLFDENISSCQHENLVECNYIHDHRSFT